MKRHLLLLMVAVCMKASAASTTNWESTDSAKIEYCESYLDYVHDDWNVSPYTCVKKNWKVRFLGERCVRFISPDEDKKKDSFLRKKPKFVRHDNSLYLNCLGVSCEGRTLGAGYLPLYSCADNGFIFIMKKINKGALYVPLAFISGGLVTSVVAVASHASHIADREYDDRRCYYYNPLNNTATMLTESHVWNMIGDDEELSNEFIKIERRRRSYPATVVYFMLRLGLIDSVPVEVRVPDDQDEE